MNYWISDLCEKVKLWLCKYVSLIKSQLLHSFLSFRGSFSQQSSPSFNEEMLQTSMHKNEDFLAPTKQMLST